MIERELRYLFARIKRRSSLKLSKVSLSPKFRVGSRLEATKILLDDNNRRLLEGFLMEIRPGDVVFDIGANIGQYAIPSAFQAGDSGEVHAFEPAPIWLGRLHDNIRLNGLSNVITHPLGLSDRAGERTFVFKNKHGSGMGSFMGNYRSHIQGQRFEEIQIRIEKGDQYLAQKKIPAPHAVKIDVEGAELEVLRGLEKGFKNELCRFILCEVHPDYLEEPMTEVENILRKYGFDTESKESTGSPHLYHIFAKKKP